MNKGMERSDVGNRNMEFGFYCRYSEVSMRCDYRTFTQNLGVYYQIQGEMGICTSEILGRMYT
jgi:hypothetical protein